MHTRARIKVLKAMVEASKRKGSFRNSGQIAKAMGRKQVSIYFHLTRMIEDGDVEGFGGINGQLKVTAKGLLAIAQSEGE